MTVRIAALLIALATGAAAPAGRAEAALVRFVSAQISGGPVALADLPLFDPALGVLESVDVTFQGVATGLVLSAPSPTGSGFAPYSGPVRALLDVRAFGLGTVFSTADWPLLRTIDVGGLGAPVASAFLMGFAFTVDATNDLTGFSIARPSGASSLLGTAFVTTDLSRFEASTLFPEALVTMAVTSTPLDPRLSFVPTGISGALTATYRYEPHSGGPVVQPVPAPPAYALAAAAIAAVAMLRRRRR